MSIRFLAFTLAVLVFVVLTAAASLVHAAIGGFDNLRWDMTRQEVQRLHPNFEEPPVPI